VPKSVSTSGILAFLSVAEQGSINRAAEMLHVSQPALTRTIKELEEDLGNQVFVRTAKGVSLTDFGRQLVAHARRLRGDLEMLSRTARSFRSEHRVEMSVGAVPVHPIGIVASTIAALYETENVAIHVVVGSQTEMIDLLRTGKVEMVLGPLLAHKSSTDLLQEIVNYESTGLYCKSSHPLARESKLRPEHLAHARWILGGRDTTLRAGIDRHFAQFGFALDIPLEIEDISLRRSIVMQSNFVSAFQGYHVFNELRSGALVRLAYPAIDEKQPIGCIRISEHTELSRKFVALLKTKYQEFSFKDSRPRKTGQRRG
jgi:DNA-binding transcriptional LysR family regulator